MVPNLSPPSPDTPSPTINCSEVTRSGPNPDRLSDTVLIQAHASCCGLSDSVLIQAHMLCLVSWAQRHCAQTDENFEEGGVGGVAITRLLSLERLFSSHPVPYRQLSLTASWQADNNLARHFAQPCHNCVA
ncbi:hypothetical protein J6590_018899 [Homalodisca vitripennis]|nr:hypothetical protein J6590_018899 [Homalodisca vitripennis]